MNSRCCSIEEATVPELQLVKPKNEKDFESQRLTETQFSDNNHIKVYGLNCLEPLGKMPQSKLPTEEAILFNHYKWTKYFRGMDSFILISGFTGLLV